MPLTTKQKALWIIGGLALLVAVILIWYFFFRDDCDPDKKGYTKKGKLSDKCFDKAQDPQTITTPPPAGCKWISDSTFPLKKCMSGNKIKALQTALGFTGVKVDGKFGTTDTLPAVQNKFGGRSEVTQAEYNALINPPATGGGSNYANLKKALGNSAKNFSSGVYVLIQGQNKNYAFDFYADNGRFMMRESATGSPILYRGTYKDGGKEMIIDNGNAYQQGGVFTNMKKIVDELGK